MTVRTTYLTTRYIIDRLFAAVMLVMLSPVMMAIVIALMRSQGRPVLFRQQRVGRHGEIFTILKFRTMIEGAEEIGDGYLVDDQQLVTPMGEWLRKTSLDELPQLINILRGDMAIIGPRPSVIDQYERYSAFQRRRLEVLPGVTGLAQVTYRVDAPWSKRIELDVEYIERVSPFLDATIAIRTVARILSGADSRWDQPRDEVDDLG
jgi:lipopolysaccharide/colanic/teichoic acid biosynthesis glycosyltransferase